MDRKKLMSKIIPAIIAGSVFVSTGTLVFAESNTQAAKNSNNKSTMQKQLKMKKSTDTAKSKLDKLVSSSTITQDEENKILDYMKNQQDARKAEMDKVKNMTKEERQAYFANKTKEKHDLAADLVKSGILSQDKADAVAKALHQGADFKGHKGDMKGNGMKAHLDKLVSSSTITQDQENKILDYIKQQQAARKAEMDKVKNMTKEERQAYFANKSKEKPDLMADLVKSGIISQDQANAIKQSMPAPAKDGKAHNKNVNQAKTK